jgi:regulator of protease activity HflC (stomatin/prohibitin superfamily)
MFVYDTRVQERKEVIPVLTKDGLEIEIELSIRFHPVSTMLGVLHQQVGPDYAKIVVIPEVESAVRTTLGKLTIEQVYGGTRAKSNQVATTSTTSAAAVAPNTAEASVESSAEGEETVDTSLVDAIEVATDQASKKYILIDKVVVTQIRIPDYVQKAIQQKVEQEEILEAQDYRLQQAIKEIDIAKNQAQANVTLGSSLNANLLKLRGIEATQKLAASPNTKIVVVGNGPNSLPVILGSEK